ncbi:hypothetical protein ACFLT2_03470 [Acidobacteriota bacterium]
MKELLSLDEIYSVYDELSETKAVDRVICSPSTKKSIMDTFNMADVIDPYLTGQPFDIFVDNKMPENVIAFSDGNRIIEVGNIRTV